MRGRPSFVGSAYQIYYSKRGRSKYRTPYRSATDWFKLFYPTFLEGKMTEPQLNEYIEQTVRDYCELFWSDTSGAAEECIEEAKATGLTSMMYPDAATRQQINDGHFADLMNGELVSVFRAIKNKLAVQAEKNYVNSLRRLANELNTKVVLQFSDSSCKTEDPSQYEGWTIAFSDIPDNVVNKEAFKRTIDKRGRANISFTEFALIQNKLKGHLTLYNPAEIEQKTYEFEIPSANRNIIYINIDLDKGGTVVDAPKLKDLELEYDPTRIETPYRLVGTYTTIGLDHQLIVKDYDEEAEAMIFLDNTMNKNARFQTAIERFFNQHSIISVDDMGNVVIGYDIIGKLDAAGKATGTFNIDVTHQFVEKTPEQFCSWFNRKVTNVDDMIYKLLTLLGGSINHKITCQYTLTRKPGDSQEYDISYIGEGTYTLNAEVVDRVDNFNMDNYPFGSQNITVDNITTRQMEATGTVKLNYSTKLK